MRTLMLIFLWLGVVGFGLVTLCGGVFAPSAPEIAVPIGVVAGTLAWGCWKLAHRQNHTAPDANAASPTPPERPDESQR